MDLFGYQKNITQYVKKRISVNEENRNFKKKKVCKNNDPIQPTAEEINNLRESEILSNNNLLQLQIDELLSSIQIKGKRKQEATIWCEKLKTFFEELETCELNTLPTSNSCEILICDQNVSFCFKPPKKVQFCGLNTLNCCVGPMLTYSIHLSIPVQCFHSKDYLNNRYFVKRYKYLSHVASKLRETNLCSTIYWEFYNNNRFLPILNIRSNSYSKVNIQIFATADKQCFKYTRYMPGTNNIKADIFYKFCSKEKMENLKLSPTPYYNCTLASDITLIENLLFIQNTFKEISCMPDGLKLIFVWLNQRELNKGLGSFTEEMVVYIILYLVVCKKINKHMNSYQITRAFWYFMHSNDLSTTPLSIGDVSDDIFSQFKAHFDIIFLDKTGLCNVTAFLNMNTYFKVKYDSQIALKMLEKADSNSFNNLFLLKHPFYLQYDGILDLEILNDYRAKLKLNENDFIHYFGFDSILLIKKIVQYLMRGFNSRVFNLVPFHIENNTWEYGTIQKRSLPRVLLGILLNPDQAFHFIELGPLLHEPKEKEFRQFWGPLISDRRFRDGSAKVAVLFETETTKEKRDIIKNIIQYLFETKLKIEYKFYYNEFESILTNDKIQAWYPSGTNEETTMKTIASYDKLGQIIRSFSMSLSIVGIKAISEVFCFTDVYPSIPASYACGKTITSSTDQNIVFNDKQKIKAAPRLVKTIECILQFEHSSKWPRDLTAIQHMKIAFYLELSKLLNERHNIISSVKKNCIDVLFEGLVFRYVIQVPIELGLLKKDINSSNLISYRNTKLSDDMEKNFGVLPKIIGAVKGLHFQHPSFGTSTCLIKRWIRAHLIDDYLFPDIAIDLLNASQYLNAIDFISISPQFAFFSFLKMLNELQLNIQPIVVNFNEELSAESLMEIDSHFQVNRAKFPPLYIVTPFDNGESIFTKENPTKEVLSYLKRLAIEALNHVESKIMERTCLDVKSLFVANWDGYNLIINLKYLANPRRNQQIGLDDNKSTLIYKRYLASDRHIPVVNFNPVHFYLSELREAYSDTCLFFHDPYGGNSIGVLWKLKALESKAFKICHMIGTKLLNNKLLLKVDAIVEDFFILGKGIVSSVDVK